MASQASLDQLPKEILDNITSGLPTLGFNALRLTCKDIECKTFDYWSKAFFKKRQFMIDEFSLQTLVDISEHAALSKVMTHLIIGLDELSASHNLPRGVTVTEFNQWRAADCAQRALLNGGGAAHHLSKALGNLPNLNTIDVRDFNSNTRFRDAIPGKVVPQWRSFGASRYQQWPRETDWLVRTSSLTGFVDAVFTAVLAAVGRSGTTVKSIEVLLRNRNICIQDDTFIASSIPGTRLATALPALTKLHLDLDSRGSPAHPVPSAVTIPQHGWFDPCTAYLRRFLALAPNLTWLRLNFHHHRHNSSLVSPSSKLISWLALRPDINAPLDAPWGEGNPAPVAPPLTRLDLGNVMIPVVVFRELLKKFTNLAQISMKMVRLQGDSDDTTKDCVWARLIRSLNLHNPKLKKLELSHIWDYTHGKFDEIVFVPEDDYSVYSSSTSFRTQGDITTDLGRLADRTWTITRWEEAQDHGESPMYTDSQDEMSVDGENDEN